MSVPGDEGKKSGENTVIQVNLLTADGSVSTKSGQTITVVVKKEEFIFSQ